jgi:hypothetical protein
MQALLEVLAFGSVAAVAGPIIKLLIDFWFRFRKQSKNITLEIKQDDGVVTKIEVDTTDEASIKEFMKKIEEGGHERSPSSE